jgi:acetoacetate decarboxylase
MDEPDAQISTEGGRMKGKVKFPLKGYTLPLSPKGMAPVIDPPPWYYGGDVMHLSFKADEGRVRKLIPAPLELGPNPGEGAVWFVEWVSCSGSRPDLAFMNPERSYYKECIILLKCEYQGIPGYFVPYIWVDNDFTLVRGFVQGFPKKLARVFITKLHHLTPIVGGKREGARMKGICEAHAERIVEGSMVFKRQAKPSEAPPVRFYLLRHFPDIEDPARPAVLELTASIVTDARVADVWVGDGDVRFMESPFEEVADLGRVEAKEAFYFSMGITITGGQVLHKYV